MISNPFNRARNLNQQRREGSFKTEADKTISGRGEAVAAITKKMGIKPCGGCTKRRKDWNEKNPYDGSEGVADKILKKLAEKL